MYREHFGLAESPFRITPHTEFFFAGANRGATLDALVFRTGRPASELFAEFTQLELEGRVERLPGGLFRRLDAAP